MDLVATSVVLIMSIYDSKGQMYIGFINYSPDFEKYSETFITTERCCSSDSKLAINMEKVSLDVKQHQ